MGFALQYLLGLGIGCLGAYGIDETRKVIIGSGVKTESRDKR